MNAERAQRELESRRTGGAALARLGGFKGLTNKLFSSASRNVRSFVEDALRADAFHRFNVINLRRTEVGKLFLELSDKERGRLIGTLLPHIAPAVESAWERLGIRPYQESLVRLPFRSPRSPQTLADIRGIWLLNTTFLLGDYDGDIRWVAQWAADLSGWSGGVDLGWLLAGAIDGGGSAGDEVFEILRASALGEHENGRMGRHVTQAFMSCRRAEAWEFVERLLLSAQRQEGLRQAILEAVDQSHPQAFVRMLRLIREENLSRFSSVVRAADTWFGFAWDGASAIKIDEIIDRVLLFLEDSAERTAALGEADAETVYLALWCIAFEDVDDAIAPATSLLYSPSPEIRFVATHFLVQTLWITALPPLVEMLADPDLRVAARALDSFRVDLTAMVDGGQLFDRLEQLMARIPKRATSLEPLVWPWWKRKLDKPSIAGAMAANAAVVPPDRMLPYVAELLPIQREAFIRQVAGLGSRWETRKEGGKRPKLSASQRRLVIELLGDASADVRRAAFEAMHSLPLLDDEVEQLIELLARKPGDLRNGCIARLRALDDDALLRAADRLIADPLEARRVAGLELLRDAAESNRVRADVQSRIERFAAERIEHSEGEKAHVSAVLGDRAEPATTDDALGLIDPSAMRQWSAPRSLRIDLDTRGARASLDALAELVLQHQETEVRDSSGEMKLLVEAVPYGFGPRRPEDIAAREAALPLGTVWKCWVQQRPATLRDPDGWELIRVLVSARTGPWDATPVRTIVGAHPWSAGERFLHGLIEWSLFWDPPAGAVGFMLDGLENSIASLTANDYRQISERSSSSNIVMDGFFFTGSNQPPYLEKLSAADNWLRRLRWWRDLFPSTLQPADALRLYGLLRAFESRSKGYVSLRVGLEDFLAPYRSGSIDQSEFIDLLCGRWRGLPRFALLRDVSARKPPQTLQQHPELLAVVDRCRRRVVEVETTRGDRETAASGLAIELRWTGGLDTLRAALPALGKAHFARNIGWAASGASRQETLSHLVLRSIPREEDTLDAFAQWARKARIGEGRLIELAIYAPQWAAHVNQILGWPGFESAVWWIHAHTKDNRSWQLPELKEIWGAQVSERTALSPGDLTEGAVDVPWFREVHAALGPDRWQALDKAAKYAAGGAGHTRAQLFARAMSGLLDRSELIGRISQSRHQDSVRALGLLPLPKEPDRSKDLLERYTLLQTFHRETRQFGSQRQQSERRAVAIGLANLARTAGYRDPQRLQWAMEQQAVADLARGPVVLTLGDVVFELSIDEQGTPDFTMKRNGKALKSVPAALRKDAGVAELRDRLQELKRQKSRVRASLEESMCRGDRFSVGELAALLEHPVLAPQLSRLVFLGDDIAGYPVANGRALRDHTGQQHIVGNNEDLHLAHPCDLFARGDLAKWQRDCFHAERVQPFKQIFRELYPITETERSTRRSRRYAGHQVNPRRALALLGSRGWVAHPEEGVCRTFHEDGLTVRLGFQEPFYTPAEVEGLTLEEVIFTRKGEWNELELTEIPSRIFSEAMRDLDLVVSIAHAGGVDPEATASTLEMRATLVEETCALLRISNIEVTANRVIVKGQLGTYSIHLGSGGVLLMPSTALPIVAVHSQHRGRLFLPFADDDPRTAEVLSKVLLFARDKDIRDPAILERIRATN